MLQLTTRYLFTTVFRQRGEANHRARPYSRRPAQERFDLPPELSIGEVVSSDNRSFTGFARDLTEREETRQRLLNMQAELIQSRDSPRWGDGIDPCA